MVILRVAQKDPRSDWRLSLAAITLLSLSFRNTGMSFSDLSIASCQDGRRGWDHAYDVRNTSVMKWRMRIHPHVPFYWGLRNACREIVETCLISTLNKCWFNVAHNVLQRWVNVLDVEISMLLQRFINIDVQTGPDAIAKLSILIPNTSWLQELMAHRTRQRATWPRSVNINLISFENATSCGPACLCQRLIVIV